VYEEIGTIPGQLLEEASGLGLVLLEALELPPQPAQQRLVDMLEQAAHRRRRVAPVVAHPPPEERIKRLGDVGHRHMRSSPKVQVPDRRSHVLRGRLTLLLKV
jgi:hypothetical protein